MLRLGGGRRFLGMPTTKPMTVYLLGCRAHVDEGGAEVSLIGLFDVVEYLPYEPANYVHSPTYVLSPTDHIDAPNGWSFQRWCDEPVYYSVDADALDQQVRPKMWGRMLAEEREMEFAAEREWC